MLFIMRRSPSPLQTEVNQIPSLVTKSIIHIHIICTPIDNKSNYITPVHFHAQGSSVVILSVWSNVLEQDCQDGRIQHND